MMNGKYKKFITIIKVVHIHTVRTSAVIKCFPVLFTYKMKPKQSIRGQPKHLSNYTAINASSPVKIRRKRRPSPYISALPIHSKSRVTSVSLPGVTRKNHQPHIRSSPIASIPFAAVPSAFLSPSIFISASRHASFMHPSRAGAAVLSLGERDNERGRESVYRAACSPTLCANFGGLRVYKGCKCTTTRGEKRVSCNVATRATFNIPLHAIHYLLMGI